MSGGDFDRMLNLDRKHLVRRERVGGDRAFGRSRLRALVRREQPRPPLARRPPADPPKYQTSDRSRDRPKPPIAALALRGEQPRNPQPRRDRLSGWRCKGVAQPLPLLVILLQPSLFLGMRREIGFDRGRALGRQATVDKSRQLLFLDAAAGRAHFILLGASSCAAGSRFKNCLKRSRPRDSRDMTVPIGTPNTRAACS
jgi:hypothetical protein